MGSGIVFTGLQGLTTRAVKTATGARSIFRAYGVPRIRIRAEAGNRWTERNSPVGRALRARQYATRPFAAHGVHGPPMRPLNRACIRSERRRERQRVHPAAP